MGVAMAGGTPIMFPAIAVCDGIAMGHEGMKYSISNKRFNSRFNRMYGFGTSV